VSRRYTVPVYIPIEETEPPPSPMGKLVTDLHAFQYEFP
jgi:hypothetical protein